MYLNGKIDDQMADDDDDDSDGGGGNCANDFHRKCIQTEIKMCQMYGVETSAEHPNN